MAKIVTVFYPGATRFELKDMSFIRWLKISEALARKGHQVDIAAHEPLRLHWWNGRTLKMQRNLRRVRLRGIDYSKYDVVKTLFHLGFETLERQGGAGHPFIIAKLGSVVGPTDMPGIYFYGSSREQQFSVQQRIARSARYVTVLSEPAGALWKEAVAADSELLLVPGAVDAVIPAPQTDPYPHGSSKRCLFSGNIYTDTCQPEANAVLVRKLNALGGQLRKYGIRLFFQGVGNTSRLDPDAVTDLGSSSYEQSWQAIHFADVGIVVCAGSHMHNNESTKIYHYLRAGLPVVCESGFPNDHVVTSSGLGWLAENGDMESMARTVARACEADWDRESAVDYILANHTWDRRAEIYDRVISEQLAHSRN